MQKLRMRLGSVDPITFTPGSSGPGTVFRSSRAGLRGWCLASHPGRPAPLPGGPARNGSPLPGPRCAAPPSRPAQLSGARVGLLGDAGTGPASSIVPRPRGRPRSHPCDRSARPRERPAPNGPPGPEPPVPDHHTPRPERPAGPPTTGPETRLHRPPTTGPETRPHRPPAQAVSTGSEAPGCFTSAERGDRTLPTRAVTMARHRPA